MKAPDKRASILITRHARSQSLREKVISLIINNGPTNLNIDEQNGVAKVFYGDLTSGQAITVAACNGVTPFVYSSP